MYKHTQIDANLFMVCTIKVSYLVCAIISGQSTSNVSIFTFFLEILQHKILPTVVNCTKIDANFIRVYICTPLSS